VNLDVNKTEKVGIKVDHTTFTITQISANSEIHKYNSTHEKRQVAVGDTIVQVNGLTARETPMRCLQELYSLGNIEMTIQHKMKVDDDSSDDERGVVETLMSPAFDSVTSVKPTQAAAALIHSISQSDVEPISDKKSGE